MHICMSLCPSDKPLLTFSNDRTRKSIVQGRIWSIRWMIKIDKKNYGAVLRLNAALLQPNVFFFPGYVYYIDKEIQLLFVS